jgi:hypothetical protein
MHLPRALPLDSRSSKIATLSTAIPRWLAVTIRLSIVALASAKKPSRSSLPCTRRAYHHVRPEYGHHAWSQRAAATTVLFFAASGSASYVRIVRALALALLLGLAFAVAMSRASATDPADVPRCAARGPLPDPTCTPGAVETVDLDVICHHSTRERRKVSEATHRAVFAEYGLPSAHQGGEYEVDHLIPLELGGSNDIANLWPEAASPTPGFHEKDVVENWLHVEVCAGRVRVEEAQRAIAVDWVDVYRRIQAAHLAPDQ